MDKRLIQIIANCKKSVSYFINNFCKIKHTSVGILPFKLFNYQLDSLRHFRTNRFNCFKKCRQSGISTLCGAYALWMAMFHNHKTILIASKSDADATAFLTRNVKFIYEYLPAWMREIWGEPPLINNEHKFGFANGSTITSLNSAPNILRSHASSLNIIDESAFIDDMEEMWAAGYPTLQTGGCLAPDSLVLDAAGLKPIQLYGDKSSGWQNSHGEVFTDVGGGHVSQSYNNGKVTTRKITTEDGHFIEASLEHKLRVLYDGQYIWRAVRDLQIGDLLILSDKPQVYGCAQPLDTNIFNVHDVGCKACGYTHNIDDIAKLSSENIGLCSPCLTTFRMLSPQAMALPRTLDVNLATFIGIIWGDGSFNQDGQISISCDRRYTDYIQYLHKLIRGLGATPRNDVRASDWSVRCNHKALIMLFNKNKIQKHDAATIKIPDIILRSNNEVKCGFLRGLFETDGSVCGNYVTFCSSSVQLVQQIQTMLLSMGMRSRIRENGNIDAMRRGRFSNNPTWVLCLKTRRDIIKFKSYIGFISNEKLQKLSSIKETKRTHNDYYDDTASLAEFYASSLGISSKTRQGILARISKKRMSRAYAKQLASVNPQLTNTTIGFLAQNDLFQNKITSIIESSANTYDITVDDSHTYIANGFISHNSVIVISCVPKGTYVISDQGPTLIDNYINDAAVGPRTIDEYSILGKGKLRSGRYFYHSGLAKTKTLHTRYGKMTGSLNHKMWSYQDGKYNYRPTENLHIGDWLAVQYGMDIWGHNNNVSDFKPTPRTTYPFCPTVITPELGYLFGLYIAEGCRMLQKSKTVGITITCGDDISAIFDALGLNWAIYDKMHYHVVNKNLVEFMEHLGFDLSNKASNKKIPERLLKCSKEVIASIIRGMYDGDGSSHKQRGTVSYNTTSPVLAEQVRILLNNFGILATQHIQTAAQSNEYINKNQQKHKVKKHNHDLYVLTIDRYYSTIFYNKIGFGLVRKQINKNAILNNKITAYDVIPNGHALCRKLFDNLPFGTWILNHKYGVNLNGVLSYQKKSVSRSTVLSLYEVARQYLSKDDIIEIEKYLDPNIIWVQINEITDGESEVFDFSLPHDDSDFWAHSVVYNGFVGHQTPRGQGNWYWETWTKSIAREKDCLFNPIQIDWWDMDWSLEYTDEISKKQMRICPRDGIRKCTSKEDIDKYGPYWSPWLEQQYIGLKTKGESHLFKQEYLAEFLGGGSTVLSRSALLNIEKSVKESPQYDIIEDMIEWVNPLTGEVELLDFSGSNATEGLRIWQKPVHPTQPVMRGTKVNIPGNAGHIYVMGVDVASGKNNDYCAIEIFDVTTQEQVAEYMGRVTAIPYAKMIDCLGRWYNNAMAVVDRTGLGDTFIEEVKQLYSNIWRKKLIGPNGDVSFRPLGYAINDQTKITLIKSLIDYFPEDNPDYRVYSDRLYAQLQIYVRKRNKSGMDTGKVSAETGRGNYDDLVMATALAFQAIPDTIETSTYLLPVKAQNVSPIPLRPNTTQAQLQKEAIKFNDPSILIPMTTSTIANMVKTPQDMINDFANQLGARPIGETQPVKIKKDYF